LTFAVGEGGQKQTGLSLSHWNSRKIAQPQGFCAEKHERLSFVSGQAGFRVRY
jgi:hypothetical protein